MSHYVVLTHISTLAAYACFEKRTLFHKILLYSMEVNISVMSQRVKLDLACVYGLNSLMTRSGKQDKILTDFEIIGHCGKNRLLELGQKEQHQHMSHYVVLTHISTLAAYACFEKRILFHDILLYSMEICPLTLCENNVSIRFFSFRCGYHDVK